MAFLDFLGRDIGGMADAGVGRTGLTWADMLAAGTGPRDRELAPLIPGQTGSPLQARVQGLAPPLGQASKPSKPSQRPDDLASIIKFFAPFFGLGGGM